MSLEKSIDQDNPTNAQADFHLVVVVDIVMRTNMDTVVRVETDNKRGQVLVVTIEEEVLKVTRDQITIREVMIRDDIRREVYGYPFQFVYFVYKVFFYVTIFFLFIDKSKHVYIGL